MESRANTEARRLLFFSVDRPRGGRLDSSSIVGSAYNVAMGCSPGVIDLERERAAIRIPPIAAL